METIERRSIQNVFSLFKSYYVVWKPSKFARTPSVYFSV